MKIVFKAKDVSEAHIVAGMLNAHGIETYVGGHYLQGAVGRIQMNDFANIQVGEDDIAEAIKLISDYEQSGDNVSEDSKPEKAREPASARQRAISKFIISISVATLLLFLAYLFK